MLLFVGLVCFIGGLLLRQSTRNVEPPHPDQAKFERRPDLPMLSGAIGNVQGAWANGLIAFGAGCLVLWGLSLLRILLGAG